TTARFPRETSSNPRPASIFTASRMVRRLTLYCAASSASLGRRVPGASSPRIKSIRRSTTRSTAEGSAAGDVFARVFAAGFIRANLSDMFWASITRMRAYLADCTGNDRAEPAPSLQAYLITLPSQPSRQMRPVRVTGRFDMTGMIGRALCAGVALAVTLGFAAGNAMALDPQAKWCSGVKIAAFPGGPQGGVFANNVYNGFRQAELDLGPKVSYYFSDWDPNKMLAQIKQALATKIDGIATYGFGGDDATDPLVDQAFAKGVIF